MYRIKPSLFLQHFNLQVASLKIYHKTWPQCPLQIWLVHNNQDDEPYIVISNSRPQTTFSVTMASICYFCPRYLIMFDNTWPWRKACCQPIKKDDKPCPRAIWICPQLSLKWPMTRLKHWLSTNLLINDHYDDDTMKDTMYLLNYGHNLKLRSPSQGVMSITKTFHVTQRWGILNY